MYHGAMILLISTIPLPPLPHPRTHEIAPSPPVYKYIAPIICTGRETVKGYDVYVGVGHSTCENDDNFGGVNNDDFGRELYVSDSKKENVSEVILK